LAETGKEPLWARLAAATAARVAKSPGQHQEHLERPGQPQDKIAALDAAGIHVAPAKSSRGACPCGRGSVVPILINM